MYEKECVKEGERLQKMKDEAADEYDIKKQMEVANESRQMIPDCVKRLTKAHKELSELLEVEKELAETEQYSTAKQVLEDATPALTLS